MRCKLLVLFLVVLLFIATAAAESTIVLDPINNDINLYEKASFKLTITNQASVTQRYSIFSFVQGWDIEPDPLKDKIIEIIPKGTKSTIITAKPTEDFSPGIYNLALNIESDHGEKHSTGLNVYVQPEKPMGYLPSIKFVFDMDKKIIPGETNTIKILLENRNPLNISGLKINLKSDIPEFKKSTSIDLPPMEKRTVEFTITPKSTQKPGKYYVFFTFETGDKMVNVESKEIEIVPVTPGFEVKINEIESFLKTTKDVSIRNQGNVENTQNVTIPVSLLEGIFSTTDAKLIKKEGQRYLALETTLSPDETIDVRIVHNFRYPLYLLALILLILAVYFYTKPLVSVGKKVSSVKKDDSLSELKITLQLKNLTHRNLKNIQIVDLVPGIADIEKGLDLGTLKPQEIKHTKKGTYVKWKLAEIDSKEDRLITYKIKSKLKIVGVLKLPRAKVIYQRKKKKRIAYSNAARISGQS